MSDDKAIPGVVQTVTDLGFPELREDILEGISRGLPEFNTESTRRYKEPGKSTWDVAHYDLKIVKDGQMNYQLNIMDVTILRIIPDRKNNSVGMEKVKDSYHREVDGLPTADGAYTKLKELLDKIENASRQRLPDKTQRPIFRFPFRLPFRKRRGRTGL